MQADDVRISRLTRNLLNLADDVTAFSATLTARQADAVSDARKVCDSASPPISQCAKRGRAAVVSWDLCHNPAGRAYVLYELLSKDWEVDLIGPMWSRYGTQLWEPLQHNDLNVRSFHCSNISEFVPQAEILAAAQHYDIVYVSKPRLPSLYLGALIKQASDCPLVLDVDDFELSFFQTDSYASVEEITADIHAALYQPFEKLATRFAQTLVSAADAITVSNVALRERFGGHILRHARDEQLFKNSDKRRDNARRRLGITKDEFALVFVGTPRVHKGILDVCKALHQLNDPKFVFHLVGDVADEQLEARFQEYHHARIVCHGNCAFNELPDVLAGADLVPLVQDVDHAVSQYQIPAKVSDALSLGIPVVATCTPPLRDLIASGVVHETTVEDLANTIVRISAMPGVSAIPHEIRQERRNFIGELGMRVNRTRMDQAIEEARLNHDAREEAHEVEPISGLFTDSVTGESPASDLMNLVKMFRDHYRGLRGRELVIAQERRGEFRLAKKPSGVVGKLDRLRVNIVSRINTYDIAFFWKQNDSALYGRRSDMIVKELLGSARVRKMIQFDAPISAMSFNDRFNNPSPDRHCQQDLTLSNLIDRQMGIYDTDALRCRTHVYSAESGMTKMLGQEVRSKGSYIRYVNEQLEEHGMRARNTIAWFCPVIWDAPELMEKTGFARSIVDLIDDQRAWNANSGYRDRLDESYKDTLGSADLVFANCQSLADTMQQHAATTIHVVPNGAERFCNYPDAPVPESLKGIDGPIVGYVGNLRDRIDWTLMHEVVPAMPDVSFVFFGPSDGNANADSLEKYENVHMGGVVRYEELAFHLKALDVGLVPHLCNQLTQKMNPLKVYNYFAAGLPIVSTEVANLERLGNVLKVATSAPEFIAAIRASLDKPVDTSSPHWQSTMNEIAWQTRVGTILEIMDRSLHRKLKKSA